MMAIGWASRRKPRRKNCICSLTIVWFVTSLVNETFCAASGSSPLSSK